MYACGRQRARFQDRYGIVDDYPRMNWLSGQQISAVVDEAIGVLENTGVLIESERALRELAGRGVRTGRKRAFFSAEMAEKSLAAAPDRVVLYGRDSSVGVELGGGSLHFNPGSSAIRILDLQRKKARKPVSRDLVDFALLTDALPGYSMQSTALVPADVPETAADSYRLYLALIFSGKPVVTGTFTGEGLAPMLEMLEIAAGGQERLRRYPRAIFDTCPTAPLTWSALTVDTLIDCASRGVPVQIVPMPLAGATSPATLYGTVVQHCAENLSGIIISQLISPGSPVVYGGSPAYFDMRKGTTPVGGVEALMINGAAAGIARHLGLPSHAYMALSDSRSLDYQCGMETAMGAAIAAVSGVNNVSGPGMHNFQTWQSMEKLIIDNEICLMAGRMRSGIRPGAGSTAADVVDEGVRAGSFLTLSDTLRKFREEAFFPGRVIDREAGDGVSAPAEGEILERARARKDQILESGGEDVLSGEKRRPLEEVMSGTARRAGMERMPEITG
ncbi:MAG: trimethylamine methyltransferase family protein [Candidatus Krumholzibacteriales bacterium]